MLFDALVALLILKIFEVEGLKALIAVGLVALIRTCHNVNCVIGTMEEQIISIENEEEE